MIEKYLKKARVKDVETNLDVEVLADSTKALAEYVHKCYHDETPPKPCRIEKIK